MGSFLRLGRATAFMLLPNVAMTCYYLAAWIDPGAAGPMILKVTCATLILEFIVLHSTVFFASFVAPGRISSVAKRTAIFMCLIAFYSFFAMLAVRAAEEFWPLFTFLIHAFSSLVGNTSDKSDFRESGRESIVFTPRWIASIVILVSAFIVAVFFPLPVLGLTREAIQDLGIPAFSQNPQPSSLIETTRVLVSGTALYFLGLALFEAVWGSWRPFHPALRTNPVPASEHADLPTASAAHSRSGVVRRMSLAVAMALLVTAVGSAGVLAALRAEMREVETSQGGVKLSVAAPSFDMKDLSGNTVRFPDDALGRLSVVSVWSPYCRECMPFFGFGRRLANDYRPRGVRFYHVSVAAIDSYTGSFAKMVGLEDPVLLDDKRQADALFGVDMYTVFVIDKSGTVRYRGGPWGAREVLENLLVGS